MYRVLRASIISTFFIMIICFSSYAADDIQNLGTINEGTQGYEYSDGECEYASKAVLIIGTNESEDVGKSSMEIHEYKEVSQYSGIEREWAQISGEEQKIISSDTHTYEDGSKTTTYEFEDGTTGQVHKDRRGSYTYYGGGEEGGNEPADDYLKTENDKRTDIWNTGKDGSYDHTVKDKENGVTTQDQADSLADAQKMLKNLSDLDVNNSGGNWTVKYKDTDGKDKTIHVEENGKVKYNSIIENDDGSEEEHEIEGRLSSNEYTKKIFLYYNWACMNMDDPTEFGDTTSFHDMGNYPVGEGVFRHVFRYYGDHIMRVTCWWRLEVWRHCEESWTDSWYDDDGTKHTSYHHREWEEFVSSRNIHDEPQDHPFSVPLICLDCPGMTLCIGSGCDCATAENRLCDEDHKPNLHIETHSELVR